MLRLIVKWDEESRQFDYRATLVCGDGRLLEGFGDNPEEAAGALLIRNRKYLAENMGLIIDVYSDQDEKERRFT